MAVFKMGVVFVSLLLTTSNAFAVCPAPGANTTASGAVGDKCGNSSTGANKACCVSAGVTTGIYWIENGGSPVVARIESACTQDVMIPGRLALEWTNFLNNKPACISIIPSFTWIGLVDANWNTPGNWATGIVPGASDVATFDDNCQANCGAVNINTAISVAGVVIESTFPASTITASANSITIGASGWIQRPGNSFTFNGASATSITGALSIASGTLTASSTTNGFASVQMSGGTLAAGSGVVTITGALSMSGGTYTSSAASTFAGGVVKSGGTITAGTALTVNGQVLNSGGDWTLASGGANSFNASSGATTITAGTVALPNAASTTSTFTTGLTLGGTAQMTVGAAATNTVTGLLTVSSTTVTAYNSAGTDNFNGGVILSGAGGMTTGLLTQNGGVTVSAGTWTLTTGTNNLNNNGLSTFAMTGGTILPEGTVSFKATGTSLNMTGGTFGAAGTTGLITFAGAVLLDPTADNIYMHNGTATVTVVGNLTLRENGGSANTVVYGDGLAASNTFGGLILIREAAGGSTLNPKFVQGATDLTMGTFSMTSSAAIASAVGGVFGNSTGTGPGSGNMTVTGNFTFQCSNRTDLNRFYGTSGILELNGATISVNNGTGCNVGPSQFDVDAVGGQLRFMGGTQAVTFGAATVTNVLTTGFTANSQTKSFGAMTVTGAITVSDSGFDSTSTTFSTITTTSTGTAISYLASGTGTTFTNSGVIAATVGNMLISSTAGTLNVTSNGGMMIGASATGANGTLTLSPSGSGALVLGGSGTTSLYGSLVSTDTGTNISGAMPFTILGNLTNYITLSGPSSSLGTTGLITINKTANANVVGIGSLLANIDQPAQSFVVTRGTLRINPAAGTCSGATSCALALTNLTINANGSIVCGVGTLTTSTITVNGGSINCAGYGFNWTGGGGNTNWDNPANWSISIVPGVTDTAVFSNAYCGSTCNATINTTQNLYGIQMLTGYTGTITHSANVTLGQGGFRQEAGTFTGGAFGFTMAGSYLKTGGTFSAPSGTTTFNATNAQSITFTTGAGTFGGPVVFTGTNAIYTMTGTMTITGQLTLGDLGAGTIAGGVLSARGNVVVNNNGFRGTNVLTMAGTGAQAITTSGATSLIPAYQITNTTGPITYTSGGTFAFTSTYNHSGAATLVTTNTTMLFTPLANATLTFRTDVYNDITYRPTATATLTTSGTLNVAGDLNIGPTAGTCTMTGGTIDHSGVNSPNVTFTGTIGCIGTTLVQISGTADRTITDASAALIPRFSVTATTGNVTFTNASILSFANNYTYSGAATLVAGTSTVRFNTNTSIAITAGAANLYNNVDFSPSTTPTYTLADTMNVQGTLNIGSTGGLCVFNKGAGAGIINMTGLVTNITGANNTRGCSGTGFIRLAGPFSGTTQTINNANGARIPNFIVTSNTPNSVVFGSNTVYSFRNGYDFSGTAAITPNTSTIQFASAAAAAINPGAGAYYRAQFDGAGPFTLSNTLTVSNRIQFGGTIGGVVNGGTIDVAGTSATATSALYSHAYTGTTALSFTGNGANATVDTVAGATFDGMTGLLTVNKPGRVLTYSNAVTFANTKPVQLTAGTLTFTNDVNTTSTTSTWTGTAGTQFNATTGRTLNIGNLVLNTAVFDKNSATVMIWNASPPCVTGALTTGNPTCGGDVTN